MMLDKTKAVMREIEAYTHIKFGEDVWNEIKEVEGILSEVEKYFGEIKKQ